MRDVIPRSRRTITERRFPGLVSLMFCLAGTSLAWRQTPPAYPELYQDPARTDQLTPADLPNLGRQVVLEATSMFVHARSELSDSPAAFRLLDQIRLLWDEADGFTAAVSATAPATRALEAGWLAFPDLDAAFQRVRSTLEVLPGDAPCAAENLQAMSRAMAVIGPLLRQGLQQTSAQANPPTGLRERSLAALRADARYLADAVRETIAEVAATREAPASVVITSELDVLRRLCMGLARLAVPWSDDRDLVSAVRPIRAQAGRIDLEARNGRLSGSALVRWGSIKARIDAIADRYQLPREVVLRLREAPALDERAIAAIEEAVKAIDDSLRENTSTAQARLPGGTGVQDESRRVQSALTLLRQLLLGRESRQSIDQAILDARTVRRRFEARARLDVLGRGERLNRLLSSIDRALAAASDGPSPTR